LPDSWQLAVLLSGAVRVMVSASPAVSSARKSSRSAVLVSDSVKVSVPLLDGVVHG